MKILLAFDKFKGALSAGEACRIAAEVLRRERPGDEREEAPLTDGGEGFAPILAGAVDGRLDVHPVRGPKGRTVQAPLGWVDGAALSPATRNILGGGEGERIAVVEMAAASGLPLLAPSERDPWATSSFGTGELIRIAAREGADRIVLGIGGSATNDLGCGALEALGVRFLDSAGRPVEAVRPDRFGEVEGIVFPPGGIPPVVIASDVRNPLLGPDGATAVFGPQKGLAEVAPMEVAAERMALRLAFSAGNAPDPAAARMGAAGGIAFGLGCLGGVRLVSGFSLVSEWIGLPRKLAEASWVLSGEGKFDGGSLSGKGPFAVLREARRHGAGLALFAGALRADPTAELGDCYRAELSDPSWPLETALSRTKERLAAEIARWARSLP